MVLKGIQKNHNIEQQDGWFWEAQNPSWAALSWKGPASWASKQQEDVTIIIIIAAVMQWLMNQK